MGKYDLLKQENVKEKSGKSYLSFGISIERTEENEPRIKVLQGLINDVYKKVGIDENEKKANAITSILLYVMGETEEDEVTEAE